MCGIVGYIGNRSANGIVLSGLRSLEYRGYDSAGIALLDKNKQGLVIKQVGRVEALANTIQDIKTPSTNMAIGHTRWATHGVPSIANAHPHTNEDQTIFVVHNGIIENYSELRDKLKKQGYTFVSQTDTEVIPHLIDLYYKELNDFAAAFEKTLGDLRGSYALLAMATHEPEKLFIAKLQSPLVLGIGKDEYIIASDPTALMEHTKEVIFIRDNEVAVITNKTHEIKDLVRAQRVERKIEVLDFDISQAVLGNYPNFMLKEIHEAPQTIRSAILGRINPEGTNINLKGLDGVMDKLTKVDRMVIVACGTSFYAGLVGEYLIEELANIPVEVQLASEFKYRSEPFSDTTALLAISQSGETADTIAAINKIKNKDILRLGIVNSMGSTIARMTDAGVYCHAGPEQAVASTKAFIAQVTVLMLIALRLSDKKNKLFKPLVDEINKLPKKAQTILDSVKEIEKIALKYKNYRNFLYIGRQYGYPCALEGALKLKEISYIHAEGCAAGEMKHGPLAMIDEEFPTFAIACDSPLLEKTYSNIQEIKARKGPVIAIATIGNKKISKLVDDVIYIPKTLPQTGVILTAIVMQLFSYYIAAAKGNNVDRPRNLAKSVTVE